MLPWSDVKPLIREIVAPVFVDMGFLTPGICMWRHREKFIDVVEFRGHRVGQILVELGCTPRLPAISQARPPECHFRARPSFGLEIDPDLLKIADDEASQRQLLAKLAAQLRVGADAWFRHFANVASARLALQQNEIFGPRHVAVRSAQEPQPRADSGSNPGITKPLVKR
jgi:hypothetical protein